MLDFGLLASGNASLSRWPDNLLSLLTAAMVMERVDVEWDSQRCSNKRRLQSDGISCSLYPGWMMPSPNAIEQRLSTGRNCMFS
jgi:hypothetical protein